MVAPVRVPDGPAWLARRVPDLEELSREQLVVLARELLASSAELAERCARAEERTAVLEAANAELAARLARVERDPVP